MALIRIFLQVAAASSLACCFASSLSSSQDTIASATQQDDIFVSKLKYGSSITTMLARLRKAVSQNKMSCMTPDKFIKCCVRMMDKICSFLNFVWDMYEMMEPAESSPDVSNNIRRR